MQNSWKAITATEWIAKHNSGELGDLIQARHEIYRHLRTNQTIIGILRFANSADSHRPYKWG